MTRVDVGLPFEFIYVPVHFSLQSLPSHPTTVPRRLRQTILPQTSACSGPILVSGLFVVLCLCSGLHALARSLSLYHSQLSVLHTLSRDCSRAIYPLQVPIMLMYGAVTFLDFNTLPAEKTHFHTVSSSTIFGMVCACVVKGQVCALALVFLRPT